MTYETVDRIKIALAVISLVGLLLLTIQRNRAPGKGRGRSARGLPPRRIALGLLAALSLATYHHFGFFHHRYLDYGWLDRRAYLHLWDLYHYYLGAKYFNELGYRNLYTATIAADAEDGARLSGVNRIRDLAGGGFLPREEVLRRAPDAKVRFSPGRWRQFTADVGAFTSRLPPAALAGIFVDHGYNPTPAWTATGSFLANRVPVAHLEVLALIDCAVLVATGVAIGLCFGWEAALAAAAFFGINAFANFSFTGGSYMRYDWLLGLALSLLMLRRGRHATAGICLAYAASVRLFPALFLFGPAVKAVLAAARTRSIPARYARLFLSFLAASLLFFGYGCLGGRGADAWRDFAAKISAHHRGITSNSVGFTMVFLYDRGWEDPVSFAAAYGYGGEDVEGTVNRVKAEEARSRRGQFLLSVLVVLGLAAVAVVGRGDEEACVWGFVPVFMLLNLSNYYYVFLALAAAAWYRGAGRRPAPLFLLTLVQVAVLWIGLSVDYSLRATSLSSLVLLLFLLVLIPVELAGNRQRIARRLADLRAARSS